MSLLVVGSVALDTVETPFGRVQEVLGGSALYSAAAASLYTQVNLVGVVGHDFPQSEITFLNERDVDLRGLQVDGGKTFRWVGRYDYDLNTTDTLATQLNVFSRFHPKLPAGYEESDLVFLANIDPELQLEVLLQVAEARLTMLDTMDFWIRGKRDALVRALAAVDLVTMNEAEARMFAGIANLVAAAKRILELGPKMLIIKKGEYGAVLFGENGYFVAPAYPLEEVKDPTGAGDAFAGGFLGYLDQTGELNQENIRKALIHGSVVASFTVGEFSLGGLKGLTQEEISQRYLEFRDFTHFEGG